jgi:sugar-specific transcriptional regulator TrmB
LSKALNQLANKTTKKPVDIEIRFHDTYIENRSSGIIADKNRLFLIKHDTNTIEAIQSDKSDVVLQYLNKFNKLWEEASSLKK